MYYWTCPRCGSNLDPGEKCDCEVNNDGRCEVRDKEELSQVGG